MMNVSSHLKVLMVCTALFAVSACSSKKTEATGGSGAATAAKGIVPGSAEDFQVNVGDRVFFNYDKSDLSAEAKATLQKQAAWLKQYPKVTVSVEGHADERGTREYNLGLGERRATATKDFLVASGVDAGRLTTVSYGKERPTCTASSEDCWAKNRRGVSVVANTATGS